MEIQIDDLELPKKTLPKMLPKNATKKMLGWALPAFQSLRAYIVSLNSRVGSLG